jgi:glycerate kinase
MGTRPRRLIVGIGGSATNDGGTGMLRAFGARFLDGGGSDLPEGGASLARLARIDLSNAAWPENVEIRVASDVTNPLCGERGATAVYGPQKGATPEMIPSLDAALARFAEVSAKTLGRDLSEAPGAGAAGGLGFALTAFLGATLQSGIDLALETANFRERAERADFIVTGEGRLDSQTGQGKTVMGIARAAKAAGKPTVAFAGEVSGDLGALEEAGLLAVASIAKGPSSLEEMMANAGNLLEDASERMMRWLSLGVRMAGG